MPRKKYYFNYKTYNMRASDYQMMLDDQNGGCAICGAKPEKGKRLDIDHDHETGEVRGLLCGLHNRLLGMGQDDPNILRRAADYLESGGHFSRFRIEVGRLITS
jgi:hypothetical protein